MALWWPSASSEREVCREWCVEGWADCGPTPALLVARWAKTPERVGPEFCDCPLLPAATEAYDDLLNMARWTSLLEQPQASSWRLHGEGRGNQVTTAAC